MDFYHTIEEGGTAEFKDRGSKFLAFTFCIRNTTEFKEQLQLVKKAHPKAAHLCYAYRIGYDGVQFRSGDDGEPSGSAGKPILGQIDSLNLTDTLVIVVRYFGGTLLGIPGLIHAYKTAAVLALQCSHIIQRPIEVHYQIQFNYTEINEVMRVMKKFQCRIFNNEMKLFCAMEVGIPRFRLQEVLYGLEIIPHLSFSPTSSPT